MTASGKSARIATNPCGFSANAIGVAIAAKLRLHFPRSRQGDRPRRNSRPHPSKNRRISTPSNASTRARKRSAREFQATIFDPEPRFTRCFDTRIAARNGRPAGGFLAFPAPGRSPPRLAFLPFLQSNRVPAPADTRRRRPNPQRGPTGGSAASNRRRRTSAPERTEPSQFAPNGAGPNRIAPLPAPGDRRQRPDRPNPATPRSSQHKNSDTPKKPETQRGPPNRTDLFHQWWRGADLNH